MCTFLFVAEELINECIPDECHPFAIACVVVSDNLTESDRTYFNNLYSKGEAVPDNVEPPLNAKKSCSLVQLALQSYGVLVIPIINPSLPFLEAILEALHNKGVPETCKLFWFIFTGHGEASNFLIDRNPMSFNDLISTVAVKVRVKE